MLRSASSPSATDSTHSSHRFDLPGTAALASAVFIWAGMPVFLRHLSTEVDPWTANGCRYPFAAVVYWPILAAAARRGRLPRAIWKRALVPAAFSLFGQVFFALAPYYNEATLIGFVIKSSVVWTLCGAMLLFPDERLLLRTARFWVGLVLAVVGVVGLAHSRGVDGSAATATGLAIVIACSAGFGLYAVSIRRFLREVHPVLAFGVVAQYVAAGTIVLLFTVGEPSAVLEVKPSTWWLLGVSAILGICISHAVFFTAIQRLGASLASSGHLVGPFITAVLARLALGEHLGATGWAAGCLMIVGGAILIGSQDVVRRAMRER